MASNKKMTHVVTHPSLYLRVDGKLQEMEKGTKLALGGGAAKQLMKKKFIAPIGEAKELDLDQSKDTKADK